MQGGGESHESTRVISSLFLHPAYMDYILAVPRVNYSFSQNVERKTENDKQKVKFRENSPA